MRKGFFSAPGGRGLLDHRQDLPDAVAKGAEEAQQDGNPGDAGEAPDGLFDQKPADGPDDKGNPTVHGADVIGHTDHEIDAPLNKLFQSDTP